jgi:hypothetical protein
VYTSVPQFAGLHRKGPANRWPDEATEEAKPRNPRINLKFVRRLRSAFRRRVFLKKLSFAGLAKLSWLRYSWLRFGLASAGYTWTWSPR